MFVNILMVLYMLTAQYINITRYNIESTPLKRNLNIKNSNKFKKEFINTKRSKFVKYLNFIYI